MAKFQQELQNVKASSKKSTTCIAQLTDVCSVIVEKSKLVKAQFDELSIKKPNLMIEKISDRTMY